MLLHNPVTDDTLELTLRDFRPADAPQVIACIRDAYGDTYVKPFLYTEEGVRSCDERGIMRFSVAETADGVLAGITAYELDEHFPGMAEIACQVILRAYHGYGLALPLALHSMHRADAQMLTGQFARALGCHKISQKTLKGMGFTACGFLLNVFDKSLFRYHFQNGSYTKVPQSIAVKRQSNDASALWLPDELQALGEDTLRALGCTWTLTPAAQQPEREDRWEQERDERHATLSLWARTCGGGFARHLSERLGAVAGLPGQTVNLYLNLSRPGSASAYEAARQLGFFFTGFLPCTADGIYMILHHPLKVSVELDGIPYIPEYAPFVEQIRRQLCQMQ